MKGTDPICQTFDGYDVYGFAVDPYENKLAAIVCGWPSEDPQMKYCQQLHDGSTVVEWDDDYAEYVSGQWYGSIPLEHFRDQSSAPQASDQYLRIELTAEAAQEYIEEIQEKTTITDNGTVWCRITSGYYEDSSQELPQYLYWSEHFGCIVGPGSEHGRLTESIEEPAKELWPIFDSSPIEGVRQLRRVLDERLPREIYAAAPLKYHSYGPNNHTFGLLGYEHNVGSEDAVNWLDALDGDSLETLRQAELDTIEQIDLWLKSKGG
jgi:hypothetical protein